MPLVTQHSRQLLKRSIISGATPSVFTGSTNHTDGTWGINDIYAGEMFWNMDDKKLWLGWENSSGNTGVDLIYPQNSSTGSCQTDFYTNNIFPCNPISPLNLIWTDNVNDYDEVIIGTNFISMLSSNIVSNGFSKFELTTTPTINLTCDDTTDLSRIDMSKQIELETIDIAATYRNYININDVTGVGIELLSEDSPNSTQAQINLTSTAALPNISLRTTGLADFSEINIEDDRISLNVNINSFLDITTPLITIQNDDGGNYQNNILIQDDDNGIRIRANGIGVGATSTISLSTTGGVSQIGLGADFIDITLQAFADDAAAGVGGLTLGNMYQTDGTGAAPLNVAGIVMIKQ